MQTMLDNLINGNLKTARQQARRFSHQKIRKFCQEDLGWSLVKAVACADYLKTGAGFQAFCDAA